MIIYMRRGFHFIIDYTGNLEIKNADKILIHLYLLTSNVAIV